MRQLKITKSITNRESQSLDKYLQDIGKEELITAEEEVELARKIKQGDQRALEKLTRANLRFVVSVAKQYQNQGLTLPDLINEGNIGLIKAAQRFDETRGFKFISYAVWWIRQSILQALAEQGRLVRLPQNKIGTYNKANKAYMAFEQEHEREPSTEELAEILEMSETEINNIFQSNTRHTSLDAPVHEAEDVAMGDLLEGGDDTDDDVMKDSLVGQWLVANFGGNSMFGLWYNIVFALLIIVFTYFYTAITVPTNKMADDLKRSGGFIPGIRPGSETSEYLDKIMSQITLPGSMFLALIAVFPAIIVRLMDIQPGWALFFGGTSLLIMVGVAIDTMQQVNSYLLNKHYDGLMKTGKNRKAVQ